MGKHSLSSLVSCFTHSYSSTLKMVVICSYETLDSIRTTWRYNPEDRRFNMFKDVYTA